MTAVACFIPTLNEREGIAETLAALEAQTRPIRKVFIMDGGSDDGTIEVIEEFRETVSYEIEIETVTEGGVRYASHLGGLQCAQYLSAEGEDGVILRAEADSRLNPKFLETAVEKLDDEDVAAFGAESRPIEASENRYRKKVLALLSNLDRLPKGRGMAFRSSDFMAVGGYRMPGRTTFETDIDCFGDVILLDKLKDRGEIAFSNQDCVYTELPSTSMSSPDRILQRMQLEARIGPTASFTKKVVPIDLAKDVKEEVVSRHAAMYRTYEAVRDSAKIALQP